MRDAGRSIERLERKHERARRFLGKRQAQLDARHELAPGAVPRKLAEQKLRRRYLRSRGRKIRRGADGLTGGIGESDGSCARRRGRAGNCGRWCDVDRV